MADGMEVDPAAIQGFVTFLADAKSQLDRVTASFGEADTTAEHFGRHWKAEGEEYVNSWGMFGPDLANLPALLDQVSAQLTAGAQLQVEGEVATIGEFKKIEAAGDTGSPSSETGGA
jgi:hypothetical protein